MNEAALRRASADIREDIGRTRLGLDFMIDALEGRVSMGSLIDEAVGMLRGRGGQAPIGALVRDHPGPAALIAAGVIWLAIENRKAVADRRRRAATTPTKRAPAKRASSGGRKTSSTRATTPRKPQ